MFAQRSKVPYTLVDKTCSALLNLNKFCLHQILQFYYHIGTCKQLDTWQPQCQLNWNFLVQQVVKGSSEESVAMWSRLLRLYKWVVPGSSPPPYYSLNLFYIYSIGQSRFNTNGFFVPQHNKEDYPI